MSESVRSFELGDDVVVGGAAPVVIMGPCVLEDEEQTLALARRLGEAAAAAKLPCIFKASFDKANRTSHASYRGPGLERGLAILAAVRAGTGLPVTTDVHEPGQVPAVAAAVDLLQVPAFLCRQSDLIAACAVSGRPTSIKKGQFMAPGDCAAVVDKFRAAGGRDLLLIERGTTFGYHDLVVDFRSLAIMRDLGVPVVLDGTHAVQSPGGHGTASGGDGRFAPALLRAALAVGVEGVFLETHTEPARSPSDGANMIPADAVPALLHDLHAIHAAIGRPPPFA